MKNLKLYPYLAGLIVSFSVNVSNANTRLSACELLLTEAESRDAVINRLSIEVENGLYEYPSNRYSVAVKKLSDDLYAIERIEGLTWYSEDYSGTRDRLAIQGDPRWNAAALGSETLKFFGIQSYKNQIMTYPSPEAVNKRIALLNEVLDFDIPLSFDISNTVSTSESYFTFVESFALVSGHPETLPMYYAHAMFSKLGAIQLPPQYLKRMHDRARLFETFKKYLAQKYEYAIPDRIQETLRLSEFRIAKELDKAISFLSKEASMLDDLYNDDGVTSFSTNQVVFENMHLFMGTTDFNDPIGLGFLSSELANDYSEFLRLPTTVAAFRSTLSLASFLTMNESDYFIRQLRIRHAEINAAAASLL